MRRPAPLIFLLAGLALPACEAPPESPVALSEPGETAYDERLVGIWYATDGATALYLHIIAPVKETVFLYVVAISAFAADVQWLKAFAYASEIDGQTYYNVKRVAGGAEDYTAPGESPGFFIVRADVTEEDTLTLRFMNTGVLKGLLKEGRARGRVVKIKHKSKIVVKEHLILDLSRPELIALIREVTPAKLFKKTTKRLWSKWRFRRLRPHAEKAKP